VKVLYIHLGGDHVAGSERSLLDVLSLSRGCVQAHVLCNAQAMADAVRQAGHQATLCREMEELSPWTDPPWRIAGLSAGVRAGLACADRFGPDLLHANNLWVNQIAQPVALMRRRRVVVHVRAKTIRSGRELSLVRLADHVIAISRSVAEPILAMRWRRGGLSVIHDPICLDQGGGDAQATAEPERIGPLRLAAAGRLSAEKGFDRCIRLLAWLRERGLEAELTVYGDGPERGVLEGLSRTLGVATSVRWAGFRKDLSARLAGADVLLVSSHREGLGRVIVEAAMVGTAAISVDVDGTGEAIEDGRTGLLVGDLESLEWREAILELLCDRDRLARMGRRAREFCRREFDPAASARATLEVYRRLVH